MFLQGDDSSEGGGPALLGAAPRECRQRWSPSAEQRFRRADVPSRTRHGLSALASCRIRSRELRHAVRQPSASVNAGAEPRARHLSPDSLDDRDSEGVAGAEASFTLSRPTSAHGPKGRCSNRRTRRRWDIPFPRTGCSLRRRSGRYHSRFVVGKCRLRQRRDRTREVYPAGVHDRPERKHDQSAETMTASRPS